MRSSLKWIKEQIKKSNYCYKILTVVLDAFSSTESVVIEKRETTVITIWTHFEDETE